MAKAFQLTAEIILNNTRLASDITKVRSSITSGLKGVSVPLNIKISPDGINKIKRLDAALRSLNNTLSKTTTTANQAATAFKNLSAALNYTSRSAKSIDTSFNRIGRATTASAKNIGAAKDSLYSYAQTAGLALRRNSAFIASTVLMYKFGMVTTQAIGEAIKFQHQMVKINQLGGETGQTIKNLSNQISSLAIKWGVSSQELSDVALTLKQTGRSANDVRVILGALAKTAVLPTFGDLKTTTEGVIAAMGQFKLSAYQVEAALGSINAVSAKFAVEADDMVIAIQKAGSVFASASKSTQDANTTLNQFISTFASVRNATRESADTIGTGMKTIFGRIQRVSVLQDLEDLGVTVRDKVTGQFIGAFDAINNMAVALQKIGPRDPRFLQIIEKVGGIRQLPRLIPMLTELRVRMDAFNVAQGATNNVNEVAVQAFKSYTIQIAQVREEWNAFMRSLVISEGFQTMLKGVLDLTKALIRLADAAKPLLPLLAVVAGAKILRAAPSIAGGFARGLRGIGGAPLPLVRNRGGVIPGSGNKDDVPAMLTRGEYVLNRGAVRKIGKENLDKINNGNMMFAAGGSSRARDARGRFIKNPEDPKEYRKYVQALNTQTESNFGVKLNIPMPSKHVEGFFEKQRIQNELARSKQVMLEHQSQTLLQQQRNNIPPSYVYPNAIPLGESFSFMGNEVGSRGGKRGFAPPVRSVTGIGSQTISEEGIQRYLASNVIRLGPPSGYKPLKPAGLLGNTVSPEGIVAAQKEVAKDLKKMGLNTRQVTIAMKHFATDVANAGGDLKGAEQHAINRAERVLRSTGGPSAGWAGFKAGVGKTGRFIGSNLSKHSSLAAIGAITASQYVDQKNPLGGALLGAGSGALLGSAAGPYGALAGAAVGGVMGYAGAQVSNAQIKAQESLAKTTEQLDKAFAEFLKSGNIDNVAGAFATANRGGNRAFLDKAAAETGNTLSRLFGHGVAAGSSLEDIARERARSDFNYDDVARMVARDKAQFGISRPEQTIMNELVEGGPGIRGFKKAQMDKIANQVIEEQNIAGQADIAQELLMDRLRTKSYRTTLFSGEKGEKLKNTAIPLALQKGDQALKTQIVNLQSQNKISEARDLAVDFVNKKLLPEMVKTVEFADSLADAMSRTSKTMDSLNLTFERMGAIADRIPAMGAQNRIESQMAMGRANGTFSMGAIARENPFSNLAGFNSDEIQSAMDIITRSVGPTPGIDAGVFSIKKIQNEIPNIFKNLAEKPSFAGGSAEGTTAQTELETAIRGLKLGDTGEIGAQLEANIIDQIEKTFSGTEIVDVEKLRASLKLDTFATDLEKSVLGLKEKLLNGILDASNTFIASVDASSQAFARIQSGRAGLSAKRTGFGLQKRQMFGQELTLAESFSPILNQLQGLTGLRGGNAADPTKILGNIQGLQTRANELREQQKNAIGNAPELERLSIELGGVNAQLQNNNEALQILADDTTRLSAIQDKLAKEQEKRQAGRNIIDKVMGGSFADRVQMIRGAGLLQQVEAGGPLPAMAEDWNAMRAALEDMRTLFGPERTQKLEQKIFGGVLGGAGLPPGAFGGAGFRPGEAPEERRLQAEFDNVVDATINAGSITLNLAEGQLKFKNAQDQAAFQAGLDQAGRAVMDQPVVGRARGGIIPGFGLGDTVPCMLSPGEFVINKRATQNNLSLLHNINQGFAKGGIVKPQRFAQGGMVSGGGSSLSLDSLTEAIQTLSRMNGTFSELAKSMDNLSKLMIPSKIELSARHDVFVVINGAEAFSSMQPAIRDLVVSETNKAMRKNINVITGETTNSFSG